MADKVENCVRDLGGSQKVDVVYGTIMVGWIPIMWPAGIMCACFSQDLEIVVL